MGETELKKERVRGRKGEGEKGEKGRNRRMKEMTFLQDPLAGGVRGGFKPGERVEALEKEQTN